MKLLRWLGRALLVLILLVLISALGVWAYLQHPKFGQLPEGERLAAITQSPNYADIGFRNIEAGSVLTPKKGRTSGLLGFLLRNKEGLRPEQPLPTAKTDVKALRRDQNILIWLGHSSFFLQSEGKRILIDPVFSDSAAPVGYFNRAFAGTNVYNAEDLPEIDWLLITHDHWDHLDYPTLLALRSKVGRVITGLGVGAHLERWGYSKDRIQEADWWDSVKLDDTTTLHVLPARHFSGRLLTRNKTLWVGFVLVTPNRRLYFSGDSGYGKHFAEIGRRFGGFDLAVLDTGQYDAAWANVHMFPEEAARAAEDLRAKALLPGHVGRFCISNHAWNDPSNRIVAASEGKPYRLLTPVIGAPVNLDDSEQRFPRWWEGLK